MSDQPKKPKPRATRIREICAKMRADESIEAWRARTSYRSRVANLDGLIEVVGSKMAYDYATLLMELRNAEIRMLNLRPNRKKSSK